MLLLLYLTVTSVHIFGQSDTAKKALPDVVVFANKFPALSKNIVQ